MCRLPNGRIENKQEVTQNREVVGSNVVVIIIIVIPLLFLSCFLVIVYLKSR
jgi:hypothetical protein